MIGINSVAEGYNVTASGLHSHAEGHTTTASGRNSHAEGVYTISSGHESHTEGQGAVASGEYSHAEGYNTTAIGQGSHAEGCYNVASGIGSHAEGSSYVTVSEPLSLTGEANATTYTTNSTAGVKVGGYLLYRSTWSKITTFVSNTSITVDSTLSNEALTDARVLLAEGIASGDSSHVEGHGNISSGDSSHAEGHKTTASGQYSHAEGDSSNATTRATHAEGVQTSAIAIGAHAEGLNTTAGGLAAHAEGSHTETKSDYAHAEGFYTTAQRKSQHAEGEYNVLDTTGNTGSRGSFVHIVGNGTADNTRSNAHTLDWAGNAWYAGNVYVGSTSGVNKDEGSKKLATEDYVNTNGGKIDSISLNGTPQTIDQNKNVNLDLSNYELKNNKVISINSSSTDTQYPSAKAVYTAIESLPEPMVFKGTVGRGGTITALPTNGSADIGDTYKVMLDGTYAGVEAKIGDTFICVSKAETSNTWEIIPSGDEPRGTVTSVTLKTTSPISIDSTAAIIDSGERTISHANSGVTAGTYKSVTVNATGHVTAGTNPTTLSGYGITDGVTKSTTIAGVDLQNNITKAEMLTALGITNTGIVGQTVIKNVWKGTESQYNALSTKDNTCLYLIYE